MMSEREGTRQRQLMNVMKRSSVDAKIGRESKGEGREILIPSTPSTLYYLLVVVESQAVLGAIGGTRETRVSPSMRMRRSHPRRESTS